MPFPVIEVHISNLATRDEIHRNSILTPAARGAVMGLGWRSYTAALRALAEIVREAGADKSREASEGVRRHEHDTSPGTDARRLGIAACGWLAVAQPVAEEARAAAAEQTQAAAPAQDAIRARPVAAAAAVPGASASSRGPIRGTARPSTNRSAHALAIIERLGYESGMWDTLIRTDSHIIAKSPKKTDGTPGQRRARA